MKRNTQRWYASTVLRIVRPCFAVLLPCLLNSIQAGLFMSLVVISRKFLRVLIGQVEADDLDPSRNHPFDEFNCQHALADSENAEDRSVVRD